MGPLSDTWSVIDRNIVMQSTCGLKTDSVEEKVLWNSSPKLNSYGLPNHGW